MLYIIYEDTCAFCIWCRRFVEKRASDGTVTFLGYNTDQAYELLREHPHLFETREETIIVLKDDGAPSMKFQACRAVARRMKRPWPLIAGVLGIVPTFLGDLGYDAVAKLRPFLSRLVGGR